MAHKPPCGLRSVIKLHLKRRKTENTFTKIRDSKVSFMRFLGARMSLHLYLAAPMTFYFGDTPLKNCYL